MNQKKVSKGFDRLSYIYDFMLWSTSGNIISKSQSILINELPFCSKTLIIGGGTGQFLYALLKSGKTESVTYIDISPKMIACSEKYLTKHLPEKREQILFITGNVESIPSEAKYDLIVTNYFLDLFNKEELDIVFNKLYKHFSKNGFWYYTDFCLDNPSVKGIRKITHVAIVQVLYTFFRFFCGISATKLWSVKTLFDNKKMTLKNETFFAGKLIRTALYTFPFK
jgi:tRNA (cmo5U34)-methyltransferase